MRTFVFSDAKSKKFWNIALTGSRYTVTYGKLGGKGQTKTKEFDDDTQAQKEHDKLVAEKLRKGYVETTPKVTATSPLLKAIEDELAENPDDLASHSVRADHLIEQGDPRGEFAQVQLALEDPSQTPQARKKLQKREAELLQQHLREWLGGLGRFLIDDWWGPGQPLQYQFARGWLDSVRLHPYPEALVQLLAQSPEARLIRQLEIVYDMRWHPFKFRPMYDLLRPHLAEDEGELDHDETYQDVNVMKPILESPYLTNLQVFSLGYHTEMPDPPIHTTMVYPFAGIPSEKIEQLLEKCPKIKELYLNAAIRDPARLFASPLLRSVRALQYYFGSNYFERRGSIPYPLQALADNPHLHQLTTLRLLPGRDATIGLDAVEAIVRSPNLPNLSELQIHMTSWGDAAARAVVDSGILKRLRILDISYCNMTDEGARVLATCDDMKHLECLTVVQNALTRNGIVALEATGISVIADEQHDVDDNDYLFDRDVE